MALGSGSEDAAAAGEWREARRVGGASAWSASSCRRERDSRCGGASAGAVEADDADGDSRRRFREFDPPLWLPLIIGTVVKRSDKF